MVSVRLHEIIVLDKKHKKTDNDRGWPIMTDWLWADSKLTLFKIKYIDNNNM